MNNNQEQLYQFEQLGKSPLEKIFGLFLLLNELKIYNAYLWKKKEPDTQRPTDIGRLRYEEE